MKRDDEKRDPFDILLDVYCDELMSMSDQDVLDGADAATSKADGLRLLEQTKVEAGRRRLAMAKGALASRKGQQSPVMSVTAAEARAYLRQACNDPKFTLAARGLDEMSDDDVLRVYGQATRLQGESGQSRGDEE